MAPKKITVLPDSKERVLHQDDFRAKLVRWDVLCFIDAEGCPVDHFDGLEDGGRYALGQPRPRQQIPSDAMAGVIAFGNDYNVNKKRRIALSDATGTARDEIMDMLELPEEGASWPNKPANVRAFPEFEWLTSNQESAVNRAKYMAHLKSNLQLPMNHLMEDVQPMRALLSVELKGLGDSRKLSGTTDVVIAKSKDVRNDAIRNSVQALFELKKPKNLKAKDHNPQTVCKHLAASYLNRSHAVVSVLTDLNRSWTFYWFAHKEQGAGVSLHKLKLNGAGAPGLSKYILESLHDTSRRETLPSTFADRLSFEAVMDTIREDRRRKRGRSDYGASHPMYQRAMFNTREFEAYLDGMKECLQKSGESNNDSDIEAVLPAAATEDDPLLAKAKDYSIQTRIPVSVKAVWDEWHGLNSFANQPIPGGIKACEEKFGTKWRGFKTSSSESKFLSRMKIFVAAVETAAAQDFPSIQSTLDEFDRVFSTETNQSFSRLLDYLLEKGYWQRGKKRKKRSQQEDSSSSNNN